MATCLFLWQHTRATIVTRYKLELDLAWKMGLEMEMKMGKSRIWLAINWLKLDNYANIGKLHQSKCELNCSYLIGGRHLIVTKMKFQDENVLDKLDGKAMLKYYAIEHVHCPIPIPFLFPTLQKNKKI